MYSLPTIPETATNAEKQTEIINALIDAIDADIELLYNRGSLLASGRTVCYVEESWNGFVRVNMCGRRSVDYTIRDSKNFNAAIGSIKRKIAKIVEEIEHEARHKQIIAKRKAIMAAILGGFGLTYNQDDLDNRMTTNFVIDTAIGPIKSSISHTVDGSYQYSAIINLNYNKLTVEEVADLLKKVTVQETR